MAKEKRSDHQSFIRQLGLFFIYVLIGSTLPFLMISKARYEEPSQFTIFLGRKSLYHCKRVRGSHPFLFHGFPHLSFSTTSLCYSHQISPQENWVSLPGSSSIMVNFFSLQCYSNFYPVFIDCPK